MPEIAFTEVFLIMIIALIVVGPERLPGLARKAGALLGKMRRFVANVKQDIDKEIKVDELKKIVEEQANSTGIHEIIEETRSSFNKAESDYHADDTQQNEDDSTPAIASADKDEKAQAAEKDNQEESQSDSKSTGSV